MADNEQDSNPYEAAAASVMQTQAAHVRNNVFNAVLQNPATVAQHDSMARALNVPLESVASDPDLAKQQSAMKALDAHKVVAQYPHLAEFLQNPTNAAKSHTDMQNLAALEQGLKEIESPAAPEIKADDENASKSTGIADYVAKLGSGLWGSFQKSGKAVNTVFGAIPSAYDYVANTLTGQNDSQAGAQWRTFMVDDLARKIQASAPTKDDNIASKVMYGVGDLTGMLAQIAMTGGMSAAAPTIAAGDSVGQALAQTGAHASRTMAFPSIVSAVNTGKDVYDQTGGDFPATLRAATAAYGTTTAMGAMPMSLPGGILTRAATGFPLGVVQGEANRSILNAALPKSMQQSFDVSDAIVQGLTGSILAGALGHSQPHEVALREAYNQAQKADKAAKDMEVLQGLGEIAGSSALRGHDPQTFKEFVKTVTDNGNLPEVWVDAHTLVESLHQSGITKADLETKLPEVANQLDAALNTRGDVRIDTADFLTHIAGSPLEQSLLPHLKTDPDGMTFQQGKDHLNQQQSDFKDKVQQLTEQNIVKDAREKELDAIKADVQQQLVDAGRSPDEARQYASLHRAWYDTMADRMGITPTDLRNRKPLSIGVDGRGGYDQSEIGQALARKVAEHFNDSVREYGELEGAEGGRVLDTDLARELSPEYRANRSRANDVHHAASAFIDKLYDLLLGQRGSGVFFTAGGSGAGKSAAKGGAKGNFDIVYDTTMSKLDGATSKIEKALKSGREVHVSYVYRDPVEALINGVIPRAERSGRTVPISFHAESHAGARDTIEKLVEKYKDNPKVKFDFIDNSRGPNNHRQVNLKDLPGVQYEGLVDRLHSTLEGARNDRKISETNYRAIAELEAGQTVRDGGGSASSSRRIESSDPSAQVGSGRLGQNDSTEESRLSQKSRGSYDPATDQIVLHKDADASTFLHESAHFFLESLHDLAQSPEAPEGIKSDFDTLLQHFKVEGDTPEDRIADWTGRTLEAKRAGHETFAEGFEQYLMTGKAPVPELQPLFGRFRAWLLRIYRDIKGEVSPDLKAVFDRMLASQEAIEQAERARAYFVPDLPAEHGVLIDQYKTEAKQATEDAIAQMQARSLRDMKWLSNAKSKMIKTIQTQADTQRREVRIEARREIMSQPVYRAWQFLTGRIGEADRIKPVSNKASVEVDPARDDLLAAIAKLGGINRESARTDLSVHENDFGTASGVFGKNVFRKKGGLSVDMMAEQLLDHGYLAAAEHGTHDIRELEERIHDAIAGHAQHSYAYDYAAANLKSGEHVNLDALSAGRLDTIDLQGLGVDQAVIDKLADRRMTQKTGAIHPDLVADMYGFNSGGELARALAEATDPRSAIEAATDKMMLERHGDLVDPVSIERAAEAAIHNEARAKMMATGLKMFTKTPISASELARVAKQEAEIAIAGQKVGELRPSQYSAAETRANKDVFKLAPKHPAGAADAQRAALLNNRLYKAANDALTEIGKGLQYLKRFDKDSIRSKVDVDIRDQIDDLLSRFDLRKNPTDAPTRPQQNLEKWIESQIAAGYTPSVSPDMLRPEFRTEYRDMTVEQFRGLVDTIKSMEHVGRERQTLTIQGEKHDLNLYVRDTLVPKLAERGVKFTAAQLNDSSEYRGLSNMGVTLDRLSSWLRSVGAQLKPQEFKRNHYDLHDITGPFGAAIFDPVIDANYNKVRMLKGLSDDFRAKAELLGKDWQKSMHDSVDNQHLIDDLATKATDAQVMMKMTRGRMIGLALHTGNESNFDKLTRGYNWAPQDVWAFLTRHMTDQDWHAVQGVWDLYEKHWPAMESMYKRLGQTTPDKIEPRPFTAKLANGGTVDLRGGYAAIKYDALRSRRGERDAAGAAINPADGLFGRDYFSRTSTTNGSMNKRVDGYTDAIDLDFHTFERAMQESIHDLAYREALINVNKILEHSEFRSAFRTAYGREDYQALQDWLGRIANADNADRSVGAAGRFLQYTRTGMVMTAIGLRATTVLKHGGSAGVKTLGYFAGGGEKFFASRMAAMAHDYTNQIESAKKKFGEINARLLQQDRDYRQTASSLFEAETLHSKAERFGHAAVAWSDMMTAVPTAWAAYDRAITEGIPKRQGGTGQPMTEKQAVAYANKVVREAHGSNVESARSNIMTAPNEAIKMFTTLYGFMNNTYGQLADSVSKFNTPGIGKPEIMARTFMAIIVPALWAGYLTEGAPKDKDEKGWALWAAKAITGEISGTVPFVRDAWSIAEGFSGSVAPDDWLSTLIHAGKDIYKVAAGDKVKHPISDIADALGMGLHIPGMGQIGKTLQYGVDAARGKEHPANPVELVKGALLGSHKH